MEAHSLWDERCPYDGCGSFTHSPFPHILPLCCFFFLLAKHFWISHSQIWHLPPFLDTHPCRNQRPWSIKALKMICRVISGSQSPWTCVMCYWNQGNSAHAAVFCQISTQAVWNKLHHFLYQSFLPFFTDMNHADGLKTPYSFPLYQISACFLGPPAILLIAPSFPVACFLRLSLLLSFTVKVHKSTGQILKTRNAMRCMKSHTSNASSQIPVSSHRHMYVCISPPQAQS